MSFFTSKNSDGVLIIGIPHHTNKSVRQKSGEFVRFCPIIINPSEFTSRE
jgi:hypothetical protein